MQFPHRPRHAVNPGSRQRDTALVAGQSIGAATGGPQRYKPKSDKSKSDKSKSDEPSCQQMPAIEEKQIVGLEIAFFRTINRKLGPLKRESGRRMNAALLVVLEFLPGRWIADWRRRRPISSDDRRFQEINADAWRHVSTAGMAMPARNNEPAQGSGDRLLTPGRAAGRREPVVDTEALPLERSSGKKPMSIEIVTRNGHRVVLNDPSDAAALLDAIKALDHLK